MEKAAISAPSLPTYGYQMPRAKGGMYMDKVRKKFLHLDSLISLSPVEIASIPFVTPA